MKMYGALKMKCMYVQFWLVTIFKVYFINTSLKKGQSALNKRLILELSLIKNEIF